MANLPDFSDLNLTKGGFYTLVNELRTYLNDSIGAVGSPEGVKLTLELDSVDNTSDLTKPISHATRTALNTKQATLVSGTNIKTINNTSLLASGNINLQATLVSGTNIRTINGISLLGSGNIDTPTVELTDSVSTTSSTIAASATAVKTAYDLANSKVSATTTTVLSATAGASYGAVGTYVLAYTYPTNTGATNFGATIAGSYLRPAGVRFSEGSNDLSISYETPALSGTWRCMGLSIYPTVTLWLRIA
jgi:hypothetical protein